MPTSTVSRIAAEQAGVFTRAQASAEGWTPHQIAYRVRHRHWVPVVGRALARPADSWSAVQLAVSAQLSFDHMVTSHGTAALLHGFPVEADGLSHVTTRRAHRSSSGIRVHRLSLSEHDVCVPFDGVAMTTKVRTALDCLSSLESGAGLALYAWLSTRRVLGRAELERALIERAGWWGTPRLRELVDRTSSGALSEAERLVHDLLRRAGLTGWFANVTVRDGDGVIGVVDLLFPTQRVVVEIVGYGPHSGREAFRRDRRRQNRLVAAGFTVLRFTWQDLTERPEDVVRQVRRALLLRTPRSSARS